MKVSFGIASSQMSISEIKRAHYLGTEVSEKWWRRYYRDGLLARGMGDFWIDASGLFFRRYLTDTPVMILFSDILDVKTGKWHSGRWAGGSPVIKIVWKKGDTLLSSGFVIARDNGLVEKIVQEIRFHIPKSSF